MIKSQIAISRAFRRWRLKKLRRNNKYVLDIFFSTSWKETNEVYVVGEFTSIPWEDKIRMNYSHFFNWYKAQIIISDWCMFKFIVDNQYVWSNHYQTVTTSNWIVNNVFKIKSHNFLFTPERGSRRRNSKLRKAWSKEETKNILFSFDKNKASIKHKDSIKNELFSFHKIWRAINGNQLRPYKKSTIANSEKYIAELKSPSLTNSLKKPKLRKLSYKDELRVRTFDENWQNKNTKNSVDKNLHINRKITRPRVKSWYSFSPRLFLINKLITIVPDLLNVRNQILIIILLSYF